MGLPDPGEHHLTPVQSSSVAQSCPTLRPHEAQHTRPPCPSPTSGVHPNPCPLSRWCHPTISSSVVPVSSCSQSLPASGPFQMSQLFASGGMNKLLNIWELFKAFEIKSGLVITYKRIRKGSYTHIKAESFCCIPEMNTTLYTYAYTNMWLTMLHKHNFVK